MKAVLPRSQILAMLLLALHVLLLSIYVVSAKPSPIDLSPQLPPLSTIASNESISNDSRPSVGDSAFSGVALNTNGVRPKYWELEVQDDLNITINSLYTPRPAPTDAMDSLLTQALALLRRMIASETPLGSTWNHYGETDHWEYIFKISATSGYLLDTVEVSDLSRSQKSPPKKHSNE